MKVLTEYPLHEANEMLNSDEWTRAMFVRDPKERILSGYLMWRPKAFFSSKTADKALNGLINKTLVKSTRGLEKCCKDRANGNFNYEILCVNHMQTFAGFLDMVEDPTTIDDDVYDENFQNRSTWSPRNLRKSPSCPDQHWSPLTQWRMDKKWYSKINFIGHLETAQWDIKRLLNRLHDDAWSLYGASGWGRHRNESVFESSTTVNHAKKTETHLSEHYTSDEIERKVENICRDDYDNKFLDLEVSSWLHFCLCELFFCYAHVIR